jgi:DNA repair photolyase
MDVTTTQVKSILTRTGGYLKGVASHSLQPYRGCTFGNAFCGVGCYVRHNSYVTQGRPWGSFLEVRENAAEAYRKQFAVEQRWAWRNGGRFSIFCSSSTDPFLPQETRFGVTRSLLEAMLDQPPDELILQTHSHRAIDALDLVVDLAKRCELRLHLSIETDRDRVNGMPPHGSSIDARFKTAARFKAAGVQTVVTVAPLCPIAEPEAFFLRIAESADAVAIDHFVGGDGTPDGSRTKRTPLPILMEQVQPGASSLAYQDEIVRIARRIMPGRVGVGNSGFAGAYE